MVYFLLLFFIVSLFLEGTLISLPLIFVSLVCLAILIRSPLLFFLAFLSGIILDTFAIRTLGLTSIFFLVFVFLLFLYQRKYEINSYPFVFISSFVGAFIYLLLFGYTNAIGQALLTSFIALIMFVLMRLSSKTTQKESFL